MEGSTQVTSSNDYKELLRKYEEERKKSDTLQAELKSSRENSVVMQREVEQEEEFIINKLIKKLEQLKKEKTVPILKKELEQEDELLANTLQKRLDKLAKEKVDLENRLVAEQEYVVNGLRKQLEQLSAEKSKLFAEKIDLENQLEAEQEYIVNKLQKQVSRLGSEKASLQKEKADLQRQVADLASSVSRLTQDRVKLEQQMEAEEESIVNRLQRRIESLVHSQRNIEAKLEARGISLTDLGIASAPASVGADNPVDWSYVYARSPSTSSTSLERTSGGRRTSLSTATSLGPHSPPGVMGPVQAHCLTPHGHVGDTAHNAPGGVGSTPGSIGIGGVNTVGGSNSTITGLRRERPLSATSAASSTM